ncbi:MAG: hypothetical protein GKS05_05345 [Nitrospirales bacterium]|nr:hypothetical protein [Nitrospirales bacterium]
MACLLFGGLFQAGAQPIQQIDVTIKDFTFLTTPMPLRRLVPTLIVIRNEDPVRHGFSSDLLQEMFIEVEGESGIIYGRGIEGLYVEPGKELAIRLTIERPGDYAFHCPIHQDMDGEILLIDIESV